MNDLYKRLIIHALWIRDLTIEIVKISDSKIVKLALQKKFRLFYNVIISVMRVMRQKRYVKVVFDGESFIDCKLLAYAMDKFLYDALKRGDVR